MSDASDIRLNADLTPIEKATLPLTTSLDRARRLCRVIKALIAVGAIVFFAASLLVWALMLFFSIQNGTMGETAISLLSFLLIVICEAVGVFLAYRIFADLVNSDSIFTTSQIKRLRGIALVFVLLFAIELLFPGGDLFFSIIGAGDIGMVETGSSLAGSPKINLSSLLFAAVFYCAAAIFEYASLLQQASDETI